MDDRSVYRYVHSRRILGALLGHWRKQGTRPAGDGTAPMQSETLTALSRPGFKDTRETGSANMSLNFPPIALKSSVFYGFKDVFVSLCARVYDSS